MHVANDISGAQLIATRDLHLKGRSGWDVTYRDLELEGKDLAKEIGHLNARLSELKADNQVLQRRLAQKSDDICRLTASNMSLQAEPDKLPATSRTRRKAIGRCMIPTALPRSFFCD